MSALSTILIVIGLLSLFHAYESLTIHQRTTCIPLTR